MRRLLIVGAVVFVLSLLANFPAALALGWFAPQALAIDGVSGTVWAGRAAQASYGRTYLGETTWRFRPSALLKGRVGYRLTARSVLGNVDTRIARGLTGKIHIATLDGRTRLSHISNLLPPQLASGLFDTGLDLALEDVVVVDGWPVRASGSVLLNGLQITGQRDILGSYQLELPADQSGDALVANFHDTAGTLAIEGTISLARDGSYRMECTAQARPGAPRTVVSTVDLMCPPAQGS